MLQLQVLWEHCQASAKCLGLLHQLRCAQDQLRNICMPYLLRNLYTLKADLKYRPRLCKSDELHKPACDSQKRCDTFFCTSHLLHHKLLQTI